jgi:C-terminal processing protease CtpA/Prc
MLGELRDGHVSINALSIGTWGYNGWQNDRPANFQESVVRSYITSLRNAGNGNLQYGFVDQDIGYLWIRSFGGSGWARDVDDILDALSASRGIIVDIRHNGGGSDLNSDVIASRFADRRREYAQVRYRNGPRHDDFTEWMKRWLEPAGKQQYTKPIIVLTNRRTFSTSESFLLQMRALPHVRVVGDTTGGGSGNPITRELPNGWTYRVPRWQETPPDGRPYEGIGLAPDVAVWVTAEDVARKRDTILDTAISLLRSGGQ